VVSAARLNAHMVMFADRPWPMRLPAIQKHRDLVREIHGREAAPPLLADFCVCTPTLDGAEAKARQHALRPGRIRAAPLRQGGHAGGALLEESRLRAHGRVGLAIGARAGEELPLPRSPFNRCRRRGHVGPGPQDSRSIPSGVIGRGARP
jgi:hypothetical protein